MTSLGPGRSPRHWRATETETTLVDMYTTSGITAGEQGDPARAALWFPMPLVVPVPIPTAGSRARSVPVPGAGWPSRRALRSSPTEHGRPDWSFIPVDAI